MHKGRLEAFSDGVIAIIITIMVLELRPPHEPTLHGLRPLVPVILSYILSFIYVGIYWNNHHHLLQASKHVSGPTLWANLHLLFWLSLVPFATSWMGESHFAALPVAMYGLVLLMCAVAYEVLRRVLIRCHEADSLVARAVGRGWKEKVSLAVYVVALPLAFATVWLSEALYAAVALMWLVPDARIERTMKAESENV